MNIFLFHNQQNVSTATGNNIYHPAYLNATSCGSTRALISVCSLIMWPSCSKSYELFLTRNYFYDVFGNYLTSYAIGVNWSTWDPTFTRTQMLWFLSSAGVGTMSSPLWPLLLQLPVRYLFALFISNYTHTMLKLWWHRHGKRSEMTCRIHAAEVQSFFVRHVFQYDLSLCAWGAAWKPSSKVY